jgi:radical SAM superfamily enzyme YgiQ (UPF0313 family)
MDDFRGVISDVGGPTANMYQMPARSEAIESGLPAPVVRAPGRVREPADRPRPLIDLLKKVRSEDGVRKVFIASGVRYDLAERSPEFIRELARHHTGGQLSVAPEHVDDEVLDKMKKPGVASYERFAEQFSCASQEAGKEQHLVPYFISGHPGSTLAGHDRPGAVPQAERNMRRDRCRTSSRRRCRWRRRCTTRASTRSRAEPVYTAKDLRDKKHRADEGAGPSW